MNIKRYRAAVLGLGASGEAAAKLLQREGAQVTVFDSGPRESVAERQAQLQEQEIQVVSGPEAECAAADFDLFVISPGINPNVRLVQNFVEQGATFIGEMELAYQFARKPIIAITGTNGKTTTTQLVESMLTAAGIRTLACGNIGLPFGEAILQDGELDFYTLEVSSFQLETVRDFKAKVAVWLNFTPDHLDRYPDMAEYKRAKLRIFERMTEEDYAVVNRRDDLPRLDAARISFSAYTNEADLWSRDGMLFFRERPVLSMNETQLTGLHNTENLLAALGVAKAIGLPWEKATAGLKSYHLLPHRCECVAEFGGVKFVNDSKATNLDALVKALESQPHPVLLIAGGKDKGFAFDSIVDLVHQKVKHAVLIGEMASRIQRTWSPATPCVVAANLRSAVAFARTQAVTGDVVLFSPGTSSFDMFKNYADRGNQFRQIVQELAR